MAGVDSNQERRRVRLARLARGLSQEELARAAGVTRQAIAGIESGKWDPSLKVAFALAEALSTTVEDLFGIEPEPGPPVEVELIEEPIGSEGIRVSHTSVGDKKVALPLEGDDVIRVGFDYATGITAEHMGATRARVRVLGAAAPTLVIAGCDPAIPLLGRPLSASREPVELLWVPCGSERALELLRQGKVHVAGAHLFDAKSGTYNSTHARSVLSGIGAEVVGFASWDEGLVVDRSHGGSVADLSDAIDRGFRLVNREKGSEARNVLDRELHRIGLEPHHVEGYSTSVRGHLLVASAIAAGLGAFGIANEAAAVTYGLRFVPLVTERYDLVIPTSLMGTKEVAALIRILGMTTLRRQIAALPGYDVSVCGEVADVF